MMVMMERLMILVLLLVPYLTDSSAVVPDHADSFTVMETDGVVTYKEKKTTYYFAEKGKNLTLQCKSASPGYMCIVYGNDNCEDSEKPYVTGNETLMAIMSRTVPKDPSVTSLLATCFKCTTKEMTQDNCSSVDGIYVYLGNKPNTTISVIVKNWEKIKIQVYQKIDPIIKNKIVFTYRPVTEKKEVLYRKRYRWFWKYPWYLVIPEEHYLPNTIYNVSINVSNILGYSTILQQINSSERVKPNPPGLKLRLAKENTIDVILSSPTNGRELEYRIRCCSVHLNDCHSESRTTKNQSFSLHLSHLNFNMQYSCSAAVKPSAGGFLSRYISKNITTEPGVPSKVPVVEGYQLSPCRHGSCITIYWETFSKVEQNGSPFWYEVNCALQWCDKKQKLDGQNFSFTMPATEVSFYITISACNLMGCTVSNPILVNGSKNDLDDIEVVAITDSASDGVNVSWTVNVGQEAEVSVLTCRAHCEMMMNCICQEEPNVVETSLDNDNLHMFLSMDGKKEDYMYGVKVQNESRIYWTRCLNKKDGVVLPPQNVRAKKEKSGVCTLHLEKPQCTRDSAYVSHFDIVYCEHDHGNGHCKEKRVLASRRAVDFTVEYDDGSPVRISVKSVSSASSMSEAVHVECHSKPAFATWAIVLIVFGIASSALIVTGCVYLLRFPRKVYHFFFVKKIVFRVPDRTPRPDSFIEVDGAGYTQIREDSTEVEESVVYDSLPTTPDHLLINSNFCPPQGQKGLLDHDSNTSEEDYEENESEPEQPVLNVAVSASKEIYKDVKPSTVTVNLDGSGEQDSCSAYSDMVDTGQKSGEGELDQNSIATKKNSCNTQVLKIGFTPRTTTFESSGEIDDCSRVTVVRREKDKAREQTRASWESGSSEDYSSFGYAQHPPVQAVPSHRTKEFVLFPLIEDPKMLQARAFQNMLQLQKQNITVARVEAVPMQSFDTPNSPVHGQRVKDQVVPSAVDPVLLRPDDLETSEPDGAGSGSVSDSGTVKSIVVDLKKFCTQEGSGPRGGSMEGLRLDSKGCESDMDYDESDED